MPAPAWFSEFVARYTLESHVSQILDGCEADVWQIVAPRVAEFSPPMLRGYTRARAGGMIRGVIQGYAAKHNLPSLGDRLFESVMNELVPRLLDRAEQRQRESRQARRAA